MWRGGRKEKKEERDEKYKERDKKCEGERRQKGGNRRERERERGENTDEEERNDLISHVKRCMHVHDVYNPVDCIIYEICTIFLFKYTYLLSENRHSHSFAYILYINAHAYVIQHPIQSLLRSLEIPVSRVHNFMRSESQ